MVSADTPRPSRSPPNCPTCNEATRLLAKLPDLRKGNTVDLYRCLKCKELIWDD